MLSIASPVPAAVMSFLDRGLWEAAAPGPFITEGLEDDPVGVLAIPHTLLGSGLEVDLAAGDVTVQVAQDGSWWPPTAGHNSLAFGDFAAFGDYTASFTAPLPMTAFGFDITGFQPEVFGSGGFNSQLFRYGSLVGTLFVPAAGVDFYGQFYGFVSTLPFDEIQLTFSTDIGTSDYVGFDEISFNSVPEPTTLTLLGLALVGLPLVRRIRGS